MSSIHRAVLCFLGLVNAMLLLASRSFADGGAHIVDSANVETPGVCHVETWGTRLASDDGLLNVSVGCTRPEWPALEMGTSVQRVWGGADDIVVGPALKLNLRPTETGLGIGLIANTGVNLGTNRAETATLIVPVSIPIGERLLLNLNGGWSYAAGREQPSQIFYGAQAQVLATQHVSVMAEVFGDSGERPGAQAGMRWNPGGGSLDLDLLIGRRVDGADSSSITFGATVRH